MMTLLLPLQLNLANGKVEDVSNDGEMVAFLDSNGYLPKDRLPYRLQVTSNTQQHILIAFNERKEKERCYALFSANANFALRCAGKLGVCWKKNLTKGWQEGRFVLNGRILACYTADGSSLKKEVRRAASGVYPPWSLTTVCCPLRPFCSSPAVPLPLRPLSCRC